MGKSEYREARKEATTVVQVPRSRYERDFYPKCTQQGRGHRSREDEEATSGQRKNDDDPSGDCHLAESYKELFLVIVKERFLCVWTIVLTQKMLLSHR